MSEGRGFTAHFDNHLILEHPATSILNQIFNVNIYCKICNVFQIPILERFRFFKPCHIVIINVKWSPDKEIRLCRNTTI